ncbi:MAG: hypothetical protein WCG14_07645 [Chlamydiia bacterium]
MKNQEGILWNTLRREHIRLERLLIALVLECRVLLHYANPFLQGAMQKLGLTKWKPI